MKIDVNTKEVINFTKKLDGLHKSKLPRAARNTLNTLAFETKKNSLQKEAKKTFTQRNKSFYRRFSRVKMAQGWEINKMRSLVGMVDSSRTGGSEQAGRNQEQQQRGGTIGGRTLIPLNTARTANNNKRNVRRKFRVSKLNVVLDSKNSKGTTQKQKFIKTAITALDRFGNDVVIKHKQESGKEYLFHLKKGAGIKTREFNIKATPIYTVKEGRKVRVSGKPFAYRAAIRTARNTNRIYTRHAQRELKKTFR